MLEGMSCLRPWLALLAATAAILLTLTFAAHAATVSVEGNILRIAAPLGEQNELAITAATAPDPAVPTFSVSDLGAPPIPGPGCSIADSGVTCVTGPSPAIDVSASDLDDSVTVGAAVPARIDGGDGDDRLTGGDAADTLLGGTGADFADGGAGDDVIESRDLLSDSAWCGAGRDSVSAEVLDFLDTACERVDYGPAGAVGRLRSLTGGGRRVPIPGQTWALVDRRILADVLYMVRRYRVRVTEGFATVAHPLRRAPARPRRGHRAGAGRHLGGRGPARALGRAAPEPPAAAVPLGRLERRRQPRPSVDLQAAARLRAAPAPVVVAHADTPRPHRADRLGLRRALGSASGLKSGTCAAILRPCPRH